MSHPAWQGVRRTMENLFVTRDWFELFVAQNLVFDGLLYPLVYRHYVNAQGAATGHALAMLTEFMNEWFEENARWVDATLKTAADESTANARKLAAWYADWRAQIAEALAPLAALALGAHGAPALQELATALDARFARSVRTA